MNWSVVLADPSWPYRNLRTGGSHRSGSAQKYPTLSLDRICRIVVSPPAVRRDAVLFLWVPVPLLPDGLRVMAAWQFTYKSALFWRKIGRLGIGYYFRGDYEMLLFGVRGRVKAFRSGIRNWLDVRPTAHSRKPAEFRALIERATAGMPDVRRVELFATEAASGWSGAGLSLNGVDLTDPQWYMDPALEAR